MNDLVDIFYKEILDMLDQYETSTVSKNFVDKVGEIETIPINIAKGELNAIKTIKARVAILYKKRQVELLGNNQPE